MSVGKISINPFLFFAVLASSMIGAQIFGISFSKISLIPLEIYILLHLKNTKIELHQEKKMLLLWFGFIIVSSTLNYIFTDSPLEGYKTVLLLNIAQTLIFLIPILLKLGDFNDIFEKTEKYILIIAKINCIWCVVQFIAWYVFSFDFNHFFFINVLHGLLGEREWTASYNDSLAVAIRPTGLNHDPAFLSILLVFGFVLTKSKFWKYFFFIGTLLAISRVGIVTIVFIALYDKYKTGLMKISIKKILYSLFFILLVGSSSFYVYSNNKLVHNQVNRSIERLSVIAKNKNSNDGTNRHVLYFPAAITTSAEMPLYNILLGVGPRTGGNAFVKTSNYKNYFELNSTMQEKTWAIECDPAELLLGMGLTGFCLYYFIMICFIKKYRKDPQTQMLFTTIIIFGIMYDVSMHPLITLLLIAAVQQTHNNIQQESKGEHAIQYR
jgi:hypothetical protein